MSRSGYNYDGDNWDMIRWRGMVASASRGKRGQAFFVDLLAALDVMPVKRLIADELEAADGEVCAIGSLGRARGLDMSTIDPDEPEQVSAAFNIAQCLAQEVVAENDSRHESPENRWQRMRDWVDAQIRMTPDKEER